MSDTWTPPTSGAWVPGQNPTDGVWVPGKSQIISHNAAGTGLLPTWSASGLKEYEACPHRLMKSKVEKIEQEKHAAADRGTAIHNIAECYVMSTWDAIAEESMPFMSDWENKIFPRYEQRFNDLRELYAQGKVEVEGEWAFTKDWEVTGWEAPDAWARMKLDLMIHESETSAGLIDHKTGKKFGNEMSHATQGMIYSIGAFMRYPKLEFISATFWYLDHDLESVQRYNREQAMQFLPRITDRATLMTSDTQLNPKPSIHNCKWCAFNKNETCEWRVNG